MPELAPVSFERVTPLVRASGMRGHLALVYEVLERRMPGEVYVDALASPRTALVCNRNGFYFAFGEPDEAFMRPLVEFYWDLNLAENYTTLFGCTPPWDALLDRLCAPLGAERESRLGFERRSQPAQPPPPEGFSLQPITAGLAGRILDGSGSGGYRIDPWFIRIAGGPQAYAALELGMALMAGDQIASLCGACGLGGGEAEMEVGTVPAYRGRGLAAIACDAFMAQCQERGLHPAYTCSSSNAPSRAVAHKLGFVEVEEIHGYRLFQVE